MNFTNQFDQQSKKIESINKTLEEKDREINNLENRIKELNLYIDNQKKEENKNRELIDKYKFQIQTHEFNKNNYDSNYNIMCQRIDEDKLRIKELEQINAKLKNDNNKLKKEIYSQNEVIENKNLMNNKLSNENKNLPLMNKKIINYENNIKSLKEENINLQKYNADLISDNKKLNQKMNKLLKEISLKENDFNIKIYDTNSKLNEANKENRNTLDDLQKCKQEKEAVIQDLEKYCNFVNQKLNEINDFLITSFNATDLTKLSEEINLSQNLNDNNNIDIKFELVENTIFEMKKNVLKYIVNMREKNNNYMNEFNNLSRDRNILESQNNEIINELNKYKENNKELENFNQEISTNYEKLKETYYKLYEEYNLFTNSNSKYVNDTHKFYFDLISKIKNLFDDKSQIDDEKDLDQILEEYIDILINKYNSQIRKNEENNEKEKDAYKKVMEISNLLEDSQNIIKKYEEENKNLKDENEKLNYRYNLLKASIDIVEYKLKSES